MDFQALKIFKCVAELGSISNAARELTYAQSYISTKIQQLEDELQTTLLYRHNRGTTLTPKGKILLEYVNNIFHLIDETRKEIRVDQTPKGPLIIGSMETTAAVRLPCLFLKYNREYPDVDIILKTGPSEQNIQGVLQYGLDGAFVAGPIEHPDLIQKGVFEEELVIVTDTAQPTLISLKDIQSRNLLVFNSGCYYRKKLEQLFHQEGLVPNKIMEFDTIEAIIGCVSAGFGVSMLPQSVIERQTKDETLRKHSVPYPYGIVKTKFIYRKEKFMPASLKKFIDMLNIEAELLGNIS